MDVWRCCSAEKQALTNPDVSWPIFKMIIVKFVSYLDFFVLHVTAGVFLLVDEDFEIVVLAFSLLPASATVA